MPSGPFHSHSPVGGGSITGSTAVGTAALIVGNKNFKELSAQLDMDLDHQEEILQN